MFLNIRSLRGDTRLAVASDLADKIAIVLRARLGEKAGGKAHVHVKNCLSLCPHCQQHTSFASESP